MDASAALGRRLRSHLDTQAQLGNVYAPDCPSRALLDHVTSRWGVLVLVLLLERPHRFAELAATVRGVSDKMLSQSLKQLVADGFIHRQVSSEPPVRVTYELTDNGRQVAARLGELVEWIEASVANVSRS